MDLATKQLLTERAILAGATPAEAARRVGDAEAAEERMAAEQAVKNALASGGNPWTGGAHPFDASGQPVVKDERSEAQMRADVEQAMKARFGLPASAWDEPSERDARVARQRAWGEQARAK